MNKFVPRIDWRATYGRFAELHGGNPLEWRGWLLFPDGWRWSATSHLGPELGPDGEGQRRELRAVYWKMRLASVNKERRELRAALIGLEQAERVHSVPLQQRVARRTTRKDERGNDVPCRIADSCDLDLEGLRNRIAWLEEDAGRCERIVEELAARPAGAHA